MSSHTLRTHTSLVRRYKSKHTASNDGLTASERSKLADRWRAGAGRKPSPAEMRELLKIAETKRTKTDTFAVSGTL